MNGLLGVVAIIGLLVWVVGIVWVFSDATVNSSQSAVLWGLVVFFGGILGILLYVLLGRDRLDANRRSSGRSDRRRGRLSHVCRSCGEEYFTDPTHEIATCRRCGGTKVDAA